MYVANNIFNATSIAIVGASREKEKVGHAVLENLLKKFNGKIYPVNPKARRISGLECYKSVKDIPGKVELAVIVVPNKIVPYVLEECGIKKIKNAIVISAGFKEAGVEGAKLERQCVEIAHKHGVRIVGPNCLGIINTSNNLNASFASQTPKRGCIAFMSQSGALCTAILDWAALEDVGFSKFVSLGNKADLAENDFMRVFSDDEETRVILAYLEGLKDGVGFMKLARRTTKQKPVIVLKSGRTTAGAKAVASHTGSLAGSDNAFTAAFKQTGVIRVDSGEELFDYAIAFSTQPLPKDDRVAIVTNAGGPGIMATDACERSNLRLSSFTPRTIRKLRSNLPVASNIYNPVDVLGDATSKRYALALETVLKDRNVDGVIVALTPQAMTDINNVAEEVVRASRKTNKPILCSFMGGIDVASGIGVLKKNGVPNYQYPEKAAKTMRAMVEYRLARKFKHKKPQQINVDKGTVSRILSVARKEGIVNLSLLDSMRILEAYGIRTCKSKLVQTFNEALEAANEIGYPVALKVVSQDILHKSDIGCVTVNVSKNNLQSAYTRVIMNARKYMPNANITGVLVQEMVSGGREVIIGMNRDPQVGPLIMFGLGGIYVEMLKDVSFRVGPLNEDEARNMISEIKGYPLLNGVRGEKPLDINSLEDSLLRLSRLTADFPEILELDVNPIKVFEKGNGYLAVDVRIILRHEK